MAKLTKNISTKIDKKTGKQEIHLRLTVSRHVQLRAKTRLFIKANQWDSAKNSPKFSSIDKDLTMIRSKLKDLEEHIIMKFSKTHLSDINSKWLNMIIDQFHFPEKYDLNTGSNTTLLAITEQFIKDSVTRKNINGKFITKGSVDQYKQTQVQLKNFANHQQKVDWETAELDYSFYDRFVTYEYQQGYCDSTVGKHIKNIKAILNSQPSSIIQTCGLLTDRRCIKPSGSADEVYLDETELNLLWLYDFTEQPILEKVRDWFLCLCWTGVRFSDLTKINAEYIKNNVFQFRQQKTNTTVAVPILPVVHSILDKYNGIIPKPCSNQRFNKLLKEVCRQVGINSVETICRSVAGRITTSKHRKYELIKSHTGRRSFASNMYLRGIPSVTIMQVTGHKTETSFLRYIKITAEQHAIKMGELFRDSSLTNNLSYARVG